MTDTDNRARNKANVMALARAMKDALLDKSHLRARAKRNGYRLRIRDLDYQLVADDGSRSIRAVSLEGVSGALDALEKGAT